MKIKTFTNAIGHSTLEGNPLFMDPSKLNFHLKPDSPAGGAGVNLAIPADIDGNLRSSGGTIDMGPYVMDGLNKGPNQ